jgi:hypothetical protein
MRQASLAGKGIKLSWARFAAVRFAIREPSAPLMAGGLPAQPAPDRERLVASQKPRKAHLDKFSLFANESACSRKFLPTRFVLSRSGQPKAQGTG